MITGFTSMIGSLPHQTAQEALEAINHAQLSIPAWPQLPRLSFREGMIQQYVEGFPGICIDDEEKRVSLTRNDSLFDDMASFYEKVIEENIEAFYITPSSSAGFHAFLNQHKELGKLDFVKGQVTGPYTFGLGLNDTDLKAVWFDSNYRDIVIKGLGMKARWQISHLKKIAHQVVMFFDEPILSALGTPAYMGIEDEEVIAAHNEIFDLIHADGAMIGVHCCGNMDWSLLTKTSVDIISFDAFSYGEKVALYPEEISGFLDRGGYLAWGIVPTNSSELIAKTTSEDLKKREEELLELFANKGITKDILKAKSIYTPSCGMGNLSPEEANKVFKLLADFKGR